MRRTLIIMLAVLAAANGGCIFSILSGVSHAVAKAHRQSLQTCAIESQPAGAVVRLNGDRVGETPCEVKRPFGDGGRDDFEFTASLDGHRTQIKEFRQFPSFVNFELEPLPEPSPELAELAACSLDDLPMPTPRPSVAVLDFQVGGDVDRDVGETLADFCREAIRRSDRLILVERSNMRAILSEEDFAATFDCDDTRCLVDFGRKLRAQLLIHGKTTRIGETRILTVKMLDVSSATVVAMRNVKTTDSLEALLDLAGPATCQLLHDALAEDAFPPQSALSHFRNKPVNSAN